MNASKAGAGLPAADKLLLSSAGILGLALGMGIAPAQATLIITDFNNPADTNTLDTTGITFGPDGGFSASLGSIANPGFDDEFNLSGNNLNLVASNNCAPFGCKLEVLAPGSTVDGSLTFNQNGAFDLVFEEAPAPDGDYYFGLDAVVGSANTYGWLEITSNDGNATLDRYAFEDASDIPAPIPAPEPASLSLFAIGAAAVLAARRRRRHQAAT